MRVDPSYSLYTSRKTILNDFFKIAVNVHNDND